MLFTSESDRQALLGLARQAVTEVVVAGQILAEIPDGGIFAQHLGVFVSLHVDKRLRGCIGVVEPDEPLGDSVVRCASTAAQHDPRFPALRFDELSGLHIEISLLSPPRAIRPEQIEIGNHGLLISRGVQRGLLLPQVAVKHGLSAEQFLAETCRKAQLLPDAWRESDTNLFGFTCEIFSSDGRSVEDATSGNSTNGKKKPAEPSLNGRQT
jgi:AmmeMemoRadiSam system protein A